MLSGFAGCQKSSERSRYVGGKQRYKCRGCHKTYREGDLRERYTNEKKMKVLAMYLEGVGIRAIERLEKDNPFQFKASFTF